MGLWSAISSAASSAWNGVTTAVSSVAGAVRDGYNYVSDRVSELREHIRTEYPTLNKVVSFVETANEVLNPINRLVEVGSIAYDGARYAWGRYVSGTPNPEALASMQGRIEHMMIRDQAVARGITTSVAGIFGESAENWMRDRMTPSAEEIAALRRATGINLTPDTAAERDMAESAENIGYYGTMVGTTLIPGSLAVRGVSLSLRGASAVSRAARFERIAETTATFSTRIDRLNDASMITSRILPNAGRGTRFGLTATGEYFVGEYIDEPLLSAVPNSILGNYTSNSRPGERAFPADNGGSVFSPENSDRAQLTTEFTNATGQPIDWTSPAAYTAPQNGTALTTQGTNYLMSSVAVGTNAAAPATSLADTTIRPIFTESVQANGGYLSNEAIADINTRVRNTINPANLSETNRTAYTQDLIRLRQDLESHPPTWGDVRVVQLQTSLFALGHDVKIDGLMGTQTQTAVNNFITNAETMFQQSGIRSVSAAPLPRSAIDLVVV